MEDVQIQITKYITRAELTFSSYSPDGRPITGQQWLDADRARLAAAGIRTVLRHRNGCSAIFRITRF